MPLSARASRLPNLTQRLIQPHKTDRGLVSFPDLLAKADLAKTLTLLARPSLEGLVHGSDFC